jgi:Tfp pilus assembly protein PilE
MFRRGRKSRRGFTLVELTLIVAVSSVALVATAGAVTSGAKLAQTASETRAAIRATQTLMERVRATPYEDIETTFNNRSWPMSDLGCGNDDGTCAVAVTPISTGSTRWTVLQIRVTASWKGTAGPATQTMSTIACDRENASAP